ncbi:hypothetical protein BDQ12DRAFT_674537 [Crucibulum laeve]|uniref:Ribosomal protein S11-domain-containing protein n=1 Tax=Crucibulum laeve TaxID=68775 RepID=A0A5C3MDB1_9AGAR|nr:hypothetical protein BDQ12DRAFT_674537 [Crucibulum laeve]
MFAAIFRSCRPSSSLATALKNPILAARYHREPQTDLNALSDLVGELTTTVPSSSSSTLPPPPFSGFNSKDSGPPTADATGYAPPSPPVSQYGSRAGIETVIAVKPIWRLHCKSTRNNTIATLAGPNEGPDIWKEDGKRRTTFWFSGGSCGFKKANRASYEAGYQCVVRMFKKIEQINEVKPIQLEIYVKGFGQGREALRNAMLAAEGMKVRPLVVSVTDRTPIKIGGTRAKKTRRL